MQDRSPARFNAVPDDPTGNTWALPKDAIVRFGKGLMNQWDVKLSPDGTYFAMGTGMGLWWYDRSTEYGTLQQPRISILSGDITRMCNHSHFLQMACI